jgi:hypothetical protein
VTRSDIGRQQTDDLLAEANNLTTKNGTLFMARSSRVVARLILCRRADDFNIHLDRTLRTVKHHAEKLRFAWPDSNTGV